MIRMECISLSTLQPVKIPSQCVIALGNFDGVHLAHRALLSKVIAVRNASYTTAACCVFCFRTPSWDTISSTPPSYLCSLEQKLKKFYDVGMEYALICDFSEICGLMPADFAQTVLQQQCHCVAAVCGFNYRFGKGGSAGAEDLRNLLKVPVLVQDEVKQNGITVSSTYIRSLLSNGQVEEAAKLLSEPYAISATVLHGKALGHKLGFPTINQVFPSRMLIPRHGVYITECEVDGKRYRGITNVGVRPTVEHDTVVNCETHLLDFEGDLYGRSVSVFFLKYLRPEIKFKTVEELKQQVYLDKEYARCYL